MICGGILWTVFGATILASIRDGEPRFITRRHVVRTLDGGIRSECGQPGPIQMDPSRSTTPEARSYWRTKHRSSRAASGSCSTTWGLRRAQRHLSRRGPQHHRHYSIGCGCFPCQRPKQLSERWRDSSTLSETFDDLPNSPTGPDRRRHANEKDLAARGRYIACGYDRLGGVCRGLEAAACWLMAMLQDRPLPGSRS